MKRYLLLLISSLFLCGIGFAQSPVSSSGTISVLIPNHLQIDIRSTDIQFTYNEAEGSEGFPPTNSSDWSFVKIVANMNWKLEVSTLGGKTVLTNPNTSMTIPASLFEYKLSDVKSETVISGSDNFHKLYPTSAIPITGSEDANFKLNWRPQPNFSGNLFAGDYSIDILYSLIEQ